MDAQVGKARIEDDTMNCWIKEVYTSTTDKYLGTNIAS
jgi:hypothetical protein